MFPLPGNEFWHFGRDSVASSKIYIDLKNLRGFYQICYDHTHNSSRSGAEITLERFSDYFLWIGEGQRPSPKSIGPGGALIIKISKIAGAGATCRPWSDFRDGVY